ncbi:DUF418 domain-containing protein [Streptomyces umbrinus]|uniref:DUF418 domain-containing protein n=1 Tax=Streptomyces umbrinus TaxID=67370 RepID=UPI003C2F7BE5
MPTSTPSNSSASSAPRANASTSKPAIAPRTPALVEHRRDACGLLLLLSARPGRRLGEVLALAGRMALTNYLTQSMVMALAFTGYGLAWYGRYGLAAVLTGCLVPYALQLTVSRWLMRHVRYGPVEWLLLAATLARRQ